MMCFGYTAEATTVALKITVEWRNAWSGWRRIQGWW